MLLLFSSSRTRCQRLVLLLTVDTTSIFHRMLLDDDVKDGGEGEWACIAVDCKSRNFHNHIVVILYAAA